MVRVNMQQKLFDLPVLKKCHKCGAEKLATKEYFRWRKDRSVFESPCKTCELETNRKYRNDNHEKLIASSRKYRNTHLEKCRESTRKYYEASPEKKREYGKKYREANPEKCRERTYKWQKENTERFKEYGKKWRQANRERLKEKSKKWRQANSEKVKAQSIRSAKKTRSKFASLFDMAITDIRRAQILWSYIIKENPCIICGNKAEEAHHLLYASKYPTLCFNLNNGVPLCMDCHIEVHLLDPFLHLIKSRKPK